MKRSNKKGNFFVRNVVILFIIFSLLGIFINYSNAKEEIILTEYEVNQNDTLWDISTKICKKSNRNLNVQNVIRQIKNINNLESNILYEGQIINIPTY